MGHLRLPRAIVMQRSLGSLHPKSVGKSNLELYFSTCITGWSCLLAICISWGKILNWSPATCSWSRSLSVRKSRDCNREHGIRPKSNMLSTLSIRSMAFQKKVYVWASCRFFCSLATSKCEFHVHMYGHLVTRGGSGNPLCLYACSPGL